MPSLPGPIAHLLEHLPVGRRTIRALGEAFRGPIAHEAPAANSVWGAGLAPSEPNVYTDGSLKGARIPFVARSGASMFVMPELLKQMEGAIFDGMSFCHQSTVDPHVFWVRVA
eukprot:11307201-Alexandrium_andersonii.AAC.1